MTAVGFGIYLGGYLVYREGLPVPAFVPDAYVDLVGRRAHLDDPSIYPEYAEAASAVARDALYSDRGAVAASGLAGYSFRLGGYHIPKEQLRWGCSSRSILLILMPKVGMLVASVGFKPYCGPALNRVRQGV
jgi:hypothetical protein